MDCDSLWVVPDQLSNKTVLGCSSKVMSNKLGAIWGQANMAFELSCSVHFLQLEQLSEILQHIILNKNIRGPQISFFRYYQSAALGIDTLHEDICQH